MQAGLPAEMLCFGSQPVARIPSADAHLTRLFIGDKPVVGLPFFCAADITRNCLPDHRDSLTLRITFAALPLPAVTLPPLVRGAEAKANVRPHRARDSECRPSFSSSHECGKWMRWTTTESESYPNWNAGWRIVPKWAQAQAQRKEICGTVLNADAPYSKPRQPVRQRS